MSSQERIVTILLRLLRGDVLTKQDLMAEFGKDESAIRRDIAAIRRLFDRELDEPDAFAKMPAGHYRLQSGLRAQGTKLTDGQLMAVGLILMASRGLATDEMKTLLRQLMPTGADHKGSDAVMRNPIFEYRGVPKMLLSDRLERLSQAIVNHELISFDFTHHGEQHHFDHKLPTGPFFGDLFFYLIVDGSDEQFENPDHGKFAKFRLDAISNLKFYGHHPTHNHDDRFQGGRLQVHTWYPYLGRPINLEIEYAYDPAYVTGRFPQAKVDPKPIRVDPDNANPCARRVYHIENAVNDGFGIRMWLLGQGGLVKILAPKYLRDYVVGVFATSLKERYGISNLSHYHLSDDI